MRSLPLCNPILTLILFLSCTVAGLAAVPAGGTLLAPVGTSTSSLTWTGGPYTAVTADPAACTMLSCDQYSLTVNIPASFYSTHPDYTVRAHIDWSGTTNDFDLYVTDAQGAAVNSSTQGNTIFEEADLGQLTSGTYTVRVVAFTTVNAAYSGTITLAPQPVDQVRLAKYKTPDFTFAAPLQMAGPDGLVFGVQDLEPRAAVDALGNIYVAGINGTPAGTDVWKSMDGGKSFAYLGQPDGAQAVSAMVGRLPGFGGGDEDIAVGTSGRVYVTGLWGAEEPLSITMCNSTDGGATWFSNPMSQYTPVVDRQWIASYGDNDVYLTFQQEGVLLVGTNSLFCLKSTDGGTSFTQITEITTPEFGVQPGFQGNIAVDQNNGYVYTVFIGHNPNEIYIARSTDGGKTFIIKLVHRGPLGASFSNVFPILAVDKGGNVHVVYSDGTNIYLTSSQDKGASWTVPVRVNNGPESKTNLSPWVEAGDAGKVNIIWWGTSSSSSMAPDADWKVFFAQSQNALAKNPTICQTAATPVFHTGPICVNGTGCAAGTRNMAEYASTTAYLNGKAMIVYPDDEHSDNPLTYFVMQSGGPGIISAPTMKTAPHTQVTSPVAEKPSRYALEQNYPNPFNPSTKINFAIAEAGRTTLTVFNLLGQQVATLIDGTLDAGYYSVQWNAQNIPSGVYFYRLQSGNYLETRKLMLTQ